MVPSDDNAPHDAPELLSQDDIDALMSEASQPEKDPVYSYNGQRYPDDADIRVEPYDFRNPAFLTEVEMRQVRIRQEQFAYYLGARLSMILRMDVLLKMSQLATVPYKTFTQELPTPAFISTFKLSELSGVGILEISPRLSMTIVDRLLGGKGHSVHDERYLTELEMALITEVVQAILEEWCRQWHDLREVNATVIGHENNGRFLQTAASDAIMLWLSLDVELGDCSEPIHLAIPYHTIEPLVREMQARQKRFTSDPTERSQEPLWSAVYEDIDVEVAAEWDAFEACLGDFLSLRKGDVLVLPQSIINETKVRIEGNDRFKGTAGLDATGSVQVELLQKTALQTDD